MLKERLRRINPALVWENVDKYPSLNARTVSVETAIKRLKLEGVTFSHADEVRLKSLRKTRNAIEHYEWKASKKEVKIIVGNALSFAFAFAHDELEIDIEHDFKHDDVWKMLLEELNCFASSHAERLEARLRTQGKFPECCDECGALTVSMRGDGGSCELCGHWQDIDNGV